MNRLTKVRQLNVYSRIHSNQYINCTKCFPKQFYFSDFDKAKDHILLCHTADNVAEVSCVLCNQSSSFSSSGFAKELRNNFYNIHLHSQGHVARHYKKVVADMSLSNNCFLCGDADANHYYSTLHKERLQVLIFYEQFCSNFRFQATDVLSKQTYKLALHIMVAQSSMRKLQTKRFDEVLKALVGEQYTPLCNSQGLVDLPIAQILCFACKVAIPNMETVSVHLKTCKPQDTKNQLILWSEPYFSTITSTFFSKAELGQS